MRVFASYGHDRNAPLIERICADLVRAGHSVWRDVDEIRSGDDWRRRIVDGLADTDWTIAFLSRHSTRPSGVCRDEWSIVLNLRAGAMITVLVEPASEIELPASMSHIQWLDLSDWASRRADREAAFDDWYRTRFDELVALLEDPSRRDFTDEIERLERRLTPVGQEIDIGGLGAGAVARRWLNERIDAWRCDPEGARVFLLTGAPGAGKSSVSAWIAHQRAQWVVAANFCRWTVDERCDALPVIRTLAFQIASRLPDVRRLLDERLRVADADEVGRKSASALFEWLIVEPLRFAIDGGRRHDRMLIVIDGLDESLRDGRSSLVETLAQGVGKLPGWIALFVTSRPEPAVLRAFSGSNALTLDLQSSENRPDVRAYIETWFAPRSGPDLVDRVLAASEGNFLYVRMFRDAVGDLDRVADAFDRLPQGLVGLYETWFRRQFPLQSDYEKVLPFFEILVAARGPVPDGWMDRLLDWPKRERARVLESVGSLVVRRPEGIAPFHKSVADWLVDEASAGPDYVVDADEGARRLFHGLSPVLVDRFAGDRPATADLFFLRQMPRHADRVPDRSLRGLLADRLWPDVWNALAVIVDELPPQRERETALAWWRLGARLGGLIGIEAEAHCSQAHRAAGDVLRLLGRREEANRAYGTALAIARRLHARDDAGPEAMRALMASLIRDGNRRVSEGDDAGALAAYGEAEGLGRRLCRARPDEPTEWRGLFVAIERVADTRLAMGEPERALAGYRDGGAILADLLAGPSCDVALQRDRMVNLTKIGDATMELGDPSGALATLAQSLVHARHLAARTTAGAQASRDVFAILVRIGDARLALGDAVGADAAYREALEPIERLGKADPSSHEWGRDLWIGCVKRCDAAGVAGDAPAAETAAGESLAIARRFSRADPGDRSRRHDLCVSLLKLGEAHLAAGRPDRGAEPLREALDLARELVAQSPGHRPFGLTLAAILGPARRVGAATAEGIRADAETLAANGDDDLRDWLASVLDELGSTAAP